MKTNQYRTASATMSSSTTRLALLLLAGMLLALTGCSSAPEQAPGITDRKDQAQQYLQSGRDHFSKASYDKAMQFYNLAMEESLLIDDGIGVARAQNAIGEVYLSLSDTNTAGDRFARALEIATRIGDDLLIVQTLSNQGKLELQNRENDAALALFDQAAGVIDRAGPRVSGILAEAAVIYHNVGVAHYRLSEREEAESYFRRSLSYNTELSRFREIASNYYMLALLARESGDTEGAIAYAAEALTADKLVENSRGIADDLRLLGSLEKLAGNMQAATTYWERAVPVYRLLNLNETATSILRELIPALRDTGDDAKANRFQDELTALTGESG